MRQIIKTEILIRQREEGRITPYNLELLERRLGYEEEFAKVHLYQPYFKKRCVRYKCRRKLPSKPFGLKINMWEHYQQYGNFCQPCWTELYNQKTHIKPNKNTRALMEAIKQAVA